MTNFLRPHPANLKPLTSNLSSHPSSLRSTKGVTLVEVIIYVAILSMFLVVLTNIFASILDVRSESEASSAISADTRYIISRLSFDVKRATAINTPTAIGATTNNLSLVIGGINYDYTIVGNNLTLANNFGNNNLNSSETKLQNITFQKLSYVTGKNTVKVTFTINSSSIRNSGPETKTITTTISLR